MRKSPPSPVSPNKIRRDASRIGEEDYANASRKKNKVQTCLFSPEWGRDGPVPVQGEDEQVEDGGGGGRVVHRQPELADDQTKVPIA